MGLFDFGKKMVKGYDKVKTKEKMTYDELYDAIKDATFEAGEPFITGEGFMRCIQFPPTGKYKLQVAIAGKTITVAKIYNGLGGLAQESVGDVLTDGWYTGVNKENREQNEMSWKVAEVIKTKLQEKGLAD